MTPLWAVLAAAIAISMAGQTLLKAGAAAPISPRNVGSGARWSGCFLYGGSAMLYIIALRRIPMSVALPCTAVSYVAAALIGHYAFAEPLGGDAPRRPGPDLHRRGYARPDLAR